MLPSSARISDDAFVGSRLDHHFCVTQRGSTLSTELIAGLSMFLANAYLLVLVPSLLANVGVDGQAALFGFVITTSLSSIFVGVVANIPVALGPGVGCASYVERNFGPSSTVLAMTCCFVSGLVLLVGAALNVPSRAFDCTPSAVKNAMPVGLGLYLALAGFRKLGIVLPDESAGLVAGPISSTSIVGVCGVLLMVHMDARSSRWKFLLPILVVALCGWIFGLAPWPEAIVGGVSPAWPPLALESVSVGRTAGPVAALVIISLFDIAGITYSCCSIAGIEDASGAVPGAYWVFVAAGFGSLLSATLSCSPAIVLGESFAGVLAGGRTGLTATTMGFCFLLTLPFYPIFSSIPLFASSPVLVVLGAQLLALLPASVSRGLLDFDDLSQGFPSFLTIVLMVFFSGIEKGIFGGLVSWACLQGLEKLTAFAERLSAAPTASKGSGEFQRIAENDEPAGTLPRRNSFSASPAPGNFPSPYLCRREAVSVGELTRAASAGEL